MDILRIHADVDMIDLGPENRVVEITYTNWRGEHGERQIVPMRVWFGSTEWHPSPQWMLDAYDLDRQAERSFALAEIRAWHNRAPDVRAR